MIHCSPSAMRPSGAMWTRPVQSAVVRIVSRIIGIDSTLRCRCLQCRPAFGKPGQIVARPVGSASPGQGYILCVPLAEPPCDLRLHQFDAEIKGVSPVCLNAEL